MCAFQHCLPALTLNYTASPKWSVIVLVALTTNVSKVKAGRQWVRMSKFKRNCVCNAVSLVSHRGSHEPPCKRRYHPSLCLWLGGEFHTDQQCNSCFVSILSIVNQRSLLLSLLSAPAHRLSKNLPYCYKKKREGSEALVFLSFKLMDWKWRSQQMCWGFGGIGLLMFKLWNFGICKCLLKGNIKDNRPLSLLWLCLPATMCHIGVWGLGGEIWNLAA